MDKKTLDEIQLEMYKCALEKGWHDREKLCEVQGSSEPGLEKEPEKVHTFHVATKLALIHGEVSEALEELRKGPGHYGIRYENGKPEGLIVELADAVIRILDLAGGLGLSVEQAIEVKHKYNLSRPYRHGNKEA